MNSSALPTTNSRWLVSRYRLILVVILLVAAILRVYGINNTSPPGLEHDEVAHWLINRDIVAGNHALYFTEAYGHEAGFHYVQTGLMILLGENAFTLRLPSAYAGLLLVAVSFALARRLFGLRTALLAAGLLAVLFWPVFYSRLALRAIALPLLSGLSAYFWWQGWLTEQHQVQDANQQTSQSGPNKRIPALPWFVLAGLLAGLTLYTYMAARAVPIFYLAFLLYLLLFHRQALKSRASGVLSFFLVFTIVSAPLVIYLLNNPGIESRISEVDAPLVALASGDLWPALENTLKFMAMFGLRGDPLWRQNVAFLPVFDLITAVFFTIGLVLSLWRWRQVRYMFPILWLFTSAIPSIFTIDAPSSIRIINALPVIGIFPAIGLEVIHFFRRLSTVSTKLSPVFWRNMGIIGLVLLFFFNFGRTWRALFVTWPANEEVRFVWQQALTDVARYLDDTPENTPVAIGGWTPESMDPPTMELTLRRDDLALRFFDPGRAIIIPAADRAPSRDEVVARLVHPAALPLHPMLVQQLDASGIHSEQLGTFITYKVDGSVFRALDGPPLATFGQEISLLAYDVARDGDAVEATTVWRVEQPAGDQRRIFFHLIDASGDILAQDDALGSPAAHWQAGDIIIQRHSIRYTSWPETGDLANGLAIGLYDPLTGERFTTEGDADSIVLQLE